ncbi:MAG: hypothetical protein JKX70_02865 [Phycisphaerales bacterium]|nr:hypothetical protein [Phycisphaerales bacterium]
MNNGRSLCALSLLTIANGLAIGGPDLICSEISSATNFGFVDDKVAYSFGTTVCNIGDEPLDWVANTNQHPLISQTLYKLKDHQITQIGIGFVRHTIIPLQSNACNLVCTPAAGFESLGAGCSSANASSVNGAQTQMGPRSEVDAFTGDFPYPFTSIGQTGDAIYKRLQVDLADVSDPDALYFVETQVITSGETTPETRANNASYRQVMFSPGSASATLTGPTYTEQAAIFAWRDHGNGIGLPDSDVMITEITIPGDGIIHAGSKATDLDDGTYRYDYAIHNQNAHRSIGSALIAIGFNQSVTSHTFNNVDYHDDLDVLIDSTEWSVGAINGEVLRNTLEDFDTNPLGNAVRWGTTYSFSFVSSNVPVNKAMQIGFFAPGDIGDPDSMIVGVVAPQSGPCIADMDGDPQLNFFDISAFLSAYANMNLNADFNGDGQFNFFDVSVFLTAFTAGCP